MSFERGEDHHRHHQNHLSPPPQDHQEEAKTPPFLMNIMATTNKGYSNTSTNTFLDPQQHHHHHHHQPYHQLQFVQHQDHHHDDSNQISFAMINHSMPSSSIRPPTNPTTTTNNNIMRTDGGGPYDLADLDQALFLYGEGQASADPSALSSVQDHQRRDSLELMRAEGSTSSGMRPPTLNIFPSQPMHVVDPSTSTTKATTGLVSPSSSGSRRPSEPSMENIANPQKDAPPPAPQSSKAIKREGNKKGPTTSSDQGRPKTPDPKTLRRLAQNREAARKSRLRKKAYVQQLESSRIKLTQLEQELQRARAQGVYLGGGGGVLGADQGVPLGMNNISSDAAVFDMEYARWLEDYHRQMCELQAAVQEHLPENELRIYVDNCIARIDDVMNLKSIVAKSDVFHIISGTWKTPAERCFMWIGGFRPSELIKIILGQIEPLTEQQLMAICEVQQATQEAEEALTQGLEALNQSLSDTIASDALSSPTNMANYMGQMAAAMNKLSTLESFVIQADNLRRQTIHHVLQLLTTRQAARSLLAVAEHFHRLRSLSSLWVARPRQD
ncbi:bZIP transcription factor TGA10 isoform X1 [Cynara cardunculus var. scolymus]|uniref:bZIP transcription factor TGA10 isoform X1 n=1 Tax=Cynara cardunculus var. scolymus TaxID=59895 RepID=UPI000D6235DC|nr:bZIP transcription factor TGA10 isoform X1 [Cynara cardunculus var. scolymus]